MGGPWEKFQTAQATQPAGKPWEKFQPAPTTQVGPPQVPTTPDEGAGAAGLQGFGQGASLGYLPEMQAGTAAVLQKALPESMGGGGTDTYEELKKQFQNRDQALRSEHPIASAAGNVGGAVAMLPASAEAKGASLIAKAAKAAAVGAGYGALQNPEVDGQGLEENLKTRLKNAAIGGATGGIAEGTLGKLGESLSKWGSKLKDKTVLKQVGANAGQINKILSKDEIPKIEGFLVNEDLMGVGKSFEDVAEQSKKALKEDGPKIQAMYDQAQKDADVVATHLGDNASGVRISGPQLADEILANTEKEFADHANQDIVMKEMEAAVKPLRNMGDNANIVRVHNYRKSLDENINWSQKAQERDAVQNAFINARNLVADKTKDTINNIDQALGGNQLDELKRLNDRYSAASTVNNISTQKVGRETAKAFMGHGIIGSGAGVGAGYLEYKRSHDPLKALGVGALVGTGVSMGRKFGPPVGYYGGKAAKSVGQSLGAVGNQAAKVGVGAASPWLYMNKDLKNGK